MLLKKTNTTTNNQGAVLLEPLIAMAIIGTSMLIFVSIMGNLLGSRLKTKYRLYAARITQEGIEIPYNLSANLGYIDFISLIDSTPIFGCTPTAPCYTDTSSGLQISKVDSPSPDKGQLIDDKYRHKITMKYVCRNLATGDIDDTCTPGSPEEDENTLKVTSQVTWNEGRDEITYQTYLIKLEN